MRSVVTATTDIEQRACAGEAAAFGALIREYDDDLRGVVWSVVRTAHATDDVMQAAYEKAFRSIRSFDQRSALKTWLYSICYHAALDHVRYEKRRRHDDLDNIVELPSRVSVAATVEQRVELAEVLAGLDPEQRALLMLTAGCGYSFDETADIVGMRRGTVASKVSRARNKITRWEDQ
jgi:RNA polymerase sigma-70 factor, ECF subfamily